MYNDLLHKEVVKKIEKYRNDLSYVTLGTETLLLALLDIEDSLTCLILNELGVYKNDILDIINTTKKDDVITGDEYFIYKNPDGTLKKMDINGISEMIYNKMKKHLISDHDKTQDTNIKNITNKVNNIDNINIWTEFKEKN